MPDPIPAGMVEGAISTSDVSPTPTDVTDLSVMDPSPAPAPAEEPPAEEAPPELPTVSLLDDPAAEAVPAPAVPAVEAKPATADEPAVAAQEAKPERVLVSPSDPVLGPKIARWLEREVAENARLSPLVGQLEFLPNLYLAFPADDPMFDVPAPEAAPVASEPASTFSGFTVEPAPAEVTAPA